MSSSYSSLKFELINTGEQSGTWGATTDTNIGTAIEQAIVGMATLTSADFTANVATLTLANTNSAQNARALCLNIAAGATSGNAVVNVPAIQKPYIVINNSSYQVTVACSGYTVVVPTGKRTVVYNDGTEVRSQIDYLPTLALGTPLSAANGGLGATSAPAAGMIPVGNGSAYQPTFIVQGTGMSITAGGGYLALATNFGPNTASTWTAPQLFAGSSSNVGANLGSFSQVVDLIPSTISGAVTQYISTSAIAYYVYAAAGNWTVNFTFSSGTTLNSVMAVGSSITAVTVVQCLSNTYYPTGVTVDGAAIAYGGWDGGAPTSAVAYHPATYTYTIIKTAANTFTVFAKQTLYS